MEATDFISIVLEKRTIINQEIISPSFLPPIPPLLHDEPSYTTGEAKVYSNFARLFSPYVKEAENIWDYLAFTNYVQFFLPCSKDDSGKVSSASSGSTVVSPMIGIDVVSVIGRPRSFLDFRASRQSPLQEEDRLMYRE